MGQESTGHWQNLETVTRSTIDQREIATLRIPGLTILAHADAGRIGERAALTALASGDEVLLSRLEPVFAMPGDSRRRALADPHLSRQPLRLIPAPGGGVRLLARSSKTRVAAEGMPIDEWREFSATEIARGVVLLLADKVTLLLHLLSPVLPQVRHFGLVGESDGILTVRQQIARVADLDVPALLRGETGTGKELVARAIHQASARSSQPFVAVNMGAIPSTLAAAELFGAAKGAFTGADRKRSGYFTRARGGTLFLDEIGETPPEVQVMLLRALETGVIQPVGCENASTTDVRILAATDARLEAEIDAGRFRAPLLHRLSGYEIRLPPLRDRRDDIGRLLVHFLLLELEALGEAHCLEAAAAGKRPWLPAPVVSWLATHVWPGNVRQLRNVARQLVIDNRGADQLRITEQIEAMLEETAPLPLSHVLPAVGGAEAGATGISEPGAVGSRTFLGTIVSIETAGVDRLAASMAETESADLAAGLGRSLRRLSKKYGGRELDRDDDRRVLLFERPIDGLGCALEYQEALQQRSRPPHLVLGARAGIHLGEVLVPSTAGDEGAAAFEIDSLTRSIVERLTSQAAAGQTLLTRSTFELARQAALEGHRLAAPDVRWLPRGELRLQEDQEETTDVFEVGFGKPVAAAKSVYRPPSEVGEEELLAALRANGFRLQPTAAALSISRTSLYALIDRSPNVRKACDLGGEEIERSRRRHDGDLDAMAAELEVSRKGLSRRMTQLGLG